VKDMALALPVSAAQAKIVKILEERMVSPAELTRMLGTGYTELKVQSMVLTLARKGKVDRTKAQLFLRDTEMKKFLDRELGSGLRKPVPANVSR
jgi:hypothetical protein